jgi:hypothetical protein
MIGLSKKDKDNWDRFALAVRQGATPQVKSDDRRQAVIAADDFIKKYQSNSVSFSHEARIPQNLCLGNAGVSREQRDKGYVATICAGLPGKSEDGQQPLAVQDLHVTKEQLEKLGEAIQNFLERFV